MSTIRVEFRSQALTRPASFWMFYPEKLPEEIFGKQAVADLALVIVKLTSEIGGCKSREAAGDLIITETSCSSRKAVE